MVGKMLVWGLLVGLAAGILGFGVSKTLGEPQVDKAIAFEDYVEHDVHHAQHEDELVSRSLQNSAGLGTGAIIFGVAMGGIFAIVFAMSYGRIGTLTARGTAAVLGLLAIVALYVVPNLKYPANPPSIGQDDTIGHRTALYLGLMLISVVAIVCAVAIRQRLRLRIGDWNATIVCGIGYVVLMGIVYVILPGVNEVPQQAIKGVVGAVTDAHTTFPPTVLWRFRVASLAIQAVVWGTIAIGFGYVAERKLARAAVPTPADFADRQA
jgi:hypothetical protein